MDEAAKWKEQAEFWQLKYLEQLSHSTQVITALTREKVASQVRSRMLASVGVTEEQIRQHNNNGVKQ